MSVSGAWGMAIVSVALVSALPLVGFAMLSRERLLGRAVPHLVSLAVGAMIGAALLELIPEGFRRLGMGSTAPLLTIAGFVAFFLLERMLSTHGHRLLRRASPTPMQPYAVLILVGDGVHNALDGAVIAASYIADPLLGFSTTIAVVLHEIPHELGDFGALVRSGLPVRRRSCVSRTASLRSSCRIPRDATLRAPGGSPWDRRSGTRSSCARGSRAEID